MWGPSHFAKNSTFLLKNVDYKSGSFSQIKRAPPSGLVTDIHELNMLNVWIKRVLYMKLSHFNTSKPTQQTLTNLTSPIRLCLQRSLAYQLSVHQGNNKGQFPYGVSIRINNSILERQESSVREHLLVGLLAQGQLVGAGEGPLMQPAVGVNGHRAALEVLDVGLPRCLFQERQQARDPHLEWLPPKRNKVVGKGSK